MATKRKGCSHGKSLNEPCEECQLITARELLRIAESDVLRHLATVERLSGSAPGANTCYVERSEVRQIIIGVSDEHVHVTEGILADVDALPIFTRADVLSSLRKDSEKNP